TQWSDMGATSQHGLAAAKFVFEFEPRAPLALDGRVVQCRGQHGVSVLTPRGTWRSIRRTNHSSARRPPAALGRGCRTAWRSGAQTVAFVRPTRSTVPLR